MDFAGLLTGKTALVTGASRGIGRGIAAALSDAGARVYATGRTIADASLPEAVTRIPCDHRDDNGIDVAIFNGRRVVAVGAGAAEVLAEGVRLGQRAAGVAGDDL